MSARSARRRGSAALAVALALVVAGCGAGGAAESSSEESSSSPAVAEVGEPLPELTLDNLRGGDALELAGLRGPVVVNLWASWCGPCREEMPVLQQFAEAHGDDVPVIGIAWEDPDVEGARTLARQAGVRYPLYHDPEGLLRAGMGLPQLVLVDAEGHVALQRGVVVDDVAQLEALVAEHLEVELPADDS